MIIETNKKIENFLKYTFILLPILYLIKLNLTTLIISLSPLIFFLIKIKAKKNFLPGIYLIFFLYLFIHSLFLKNFSEFYYLRFLFFLIIVVTIINFKDFELIYKFLFITILIVFLDVILQLITGYNFFGYIKQSDFITSFFNDEKILGTFLLKIYLLLFMTSLLLDKEKLILLTIYLYPVVFFLISLSGQRVPFLNGIFLFLILFAYILNKKKLFILLGLIIVFLISLQFLNNKNNLFDYTSYRINFIYQKITSPPPIIPKFTLYNLYGFEKVTFDEKIKQKKYLQYDEIFGYGYIGNKKEDLSISKFVKDSRLNEKTTFYPCFKKVRHEFMDYCQDDFNQKDLKTKYELLENRKLTNKDYILVVQSKTAFLHTFKDLGWYAHARIAFEMWKQNPFFGIGVKKFRDDCFDIKYKNFDSFSSHLCPSHPHYYPIEILSEVGIFGFVLLFLILISILLIIIESKLELKKKIILFLSVLIFFQFWLPSGRFFSSNEAFYFVYFLSIFLIYRKNNKSYK